MTSDLFDLFYRRLPQEGPVAMETRLHPSELEALDAFAHVLGVDRVTALKTATVNQLVKRQSDEPMASDLRMQLAFSVPRPSDESFQSSAIVSDRYEPEIMALVDHYALVTGCRTRFAVPRHALCCELIERGLIPHVPAPIGFGDETFV